MWSSFLLLAVSKLYVYTTVLETSIFTKKLPVVLAGSL
jgi:hypothetical protein